MKAYIAVTDYDWFTFLASMPDIDEINFWQPGGKSVFKALEPGELFLFKLHSPNNFVVGGGVFRHSTILPLGLAWEAFGEKNGCRDLLEMKGRIRKYRKTADLPNDEDKVGCIIINNPFFLKEMDWVAVPEDWSLNIVQGKTYDLATGHGLNLWSKIHLRTTGIIDPIKEEKIEANRYGAPVEITPRLGQGTFRIVVTDAYQRRCAITGERTLPVLEAAHIKPFSNNGPMAVNNGSLLRSDLHKLFDKGYVTITPSFHFEVSKRLKEDYENGREYYALHGRNSFKPELRMAPSDSLLSWHNENVYLG